MQRSPEYLVSTASKNEMWERVIGSERNREDLPVVCLQLRDWI